jgi:hypothetical protein
MLNKDDINVDSLWIINERDKSGKHANIYLSTDTQKRMIDLFLGNMGSSTTPFER